MMRFTQFITFTKYYCAEQVVDDEMGGADNTHGRDDKCLENFCRKE
jgi:hypothetical protein